MGRDEDGVDGKERQRGEEWIRSGNEKKGVGYLQECTELLAVGMPVDALPVLKNKDTGSWCA